MHVYFYKKMVNNFLKAEYFLWVNMIMKAISFDSDCVTIIKENKIRKKT